LLLINTFCAADVSAQVSKLKTEEEYRKAAFDTLVKYSKTVRETGKNNVHPAISMFNKPLGIPLNSPYCSTCGIYFWKSVGVKFPGVDGRAYSWRKPKLLIWHRGFLAIDKKYWPQVKYMDAVICTWSHVEYTAMDNWSDYSTGLITGGCNTKGGRKVEGVYHPIYRPWSMILGIYDHFTPYYQQNLKSKL
jgi:hypothetical protein